MSPHSLSQVDDPTILLILSPYGTIVDGSVDNWNDQPIMRFVHNDDLIQLCASLSLAYKQKNNTTQQHRIRIQSPCLKINEDSPYQWYALTIAAHPQSQKLSVILEPSKPVASSPTTHIYDWIVTDLRNRILRALEHGLVFVAQALVTLVQVLQNRGFQFKSLRPEITERLLGMLAWTGFVKDLGLARSLVDKLLDQCIEWYLDQALKSGPTPRLCESLI